MITDDQLKTLILDADVVPPAELESAYQLAKQQQQPLATILIDRDLLSDEHLGQLIAEQIGFNFVNLRKTVLVDAILRIVPEAMARTLQVIAFDDKSDTIALAMANPHDLDTVHLLEKKTGKTAQVFYATERDIHEAISLYRRGLQYEFAAIIKEQADAASRASVATANISVVKIFDTIILYAYQQKASDVHIEPTPDAVVVRFRVDGVLHDMVTLPKHLLDLMITRIKILAKLRTDEHRAAQDGKLVQTLEEEDLDIRVSILPVSEGEKAVLRLLSSRSRQFALEDLGLNEQGVIAVHEAIKRPQGMVLVTGPTGSGKTTTLYALLKILNRREVNISTIEDPVEYAIGGINQIQVNEATNLTFAHGLRSIVRQDPDIIMIGEIRDEETAGIAVNSALTGHLVLSTLHTNNAATTLPRLLDMKVEPFLVASTVQIAAGQRLVRKICSQCIMSQVVTGKELTTLKQNPTLVHYINATTASLRLYKGKGCANCNFSGYQGRIGVFEILTMTPAIRELIMQHANADTIQQQAVRDGMTTMFADGMRKALLGQTSLDEVLRMLVE